MCIVLITRFHYCFFSFLSYMANLFYYSMYLCCMITCLFNISNNNNNNNNNNINNKRLKTVRTLVVTSLHVGIRLISRSFNRNESTLKPSRSSKLSWFSELSQSF